MVDKERIMVAFNYGFSNWTDVLVDRKEFTVYKDGYPVTEGHILFVQRRKLAKSY